MAKAPLDPGKIVGFQTAGGDFRLPSPPAQDKPFFTEDRAAKIRAHTAVWMAVHDPEASAEKMEEYLKSRKPFEI